MKFVVSLLPVSSIQTYVADPDPLVLRGTVTDPDPSKFYHLAKNSKKNTDSYCFVTSLWLFIFEKLCKVASKSKKQKYFVAILKITDEAEPDRNPP